MAGVVAEEEVLVGLVVLVVEALVAEVQVEVGKLTSLKSKN